MKGIFQMVGAPGTGKSTLCDLLIHELVLSASILAIDASPDHQLTQRLTLEPPKQTIGKLVQQFKGMSHPTQESIDWAFSDITSSVGDDLELISVGELSDDLSETEKKTIVYGLNRLMDSYDFIIIDGRHPRLYHLLQHKEMIRLIWVATPEHYDFDPSVYERFQTPALILNQMPAGGEVPEEFETALNKALESESLVLVGRLPFYADPDERVRQLPGVFRDCLYRLDLPAEHSDSQTT